MTCPQKPCPTVDLLRRVVDHADVGHVWNFQFHCPAKYERVNCMCGLAALEREIDEALRAPPEGAP